ncbi:MAG: MFS transporter [Myxococcales bacterium]|nr:MFS transporter [Myxococcales bacterium]
MRTVRIYATIEFTYNLARSCFHAVYGVFLAERGLSVEQITLLRIIFFAVIVVCELPTGMLADKIGRILATKLSVVFCAAGYAAYFFGADYYGFVSAVLLTGIGFALHSGSLEAWAVDALHREDPNYPLEQLFSKGKQAETQGMIVGALGGAIIAAVYMNGIWLLGLTGMLATLGIMMATVSEPTQTSEPIPFPSPAQLRRGVIHGLPFVALLLVSMAYFFFNQPTFLYWQIYFKDLLHLTTREGGWDVNQPILGVIYFLMHQSVSLGAWLAPRLPGSPSARLIGGGILMGLPFLVCGFTSSVWVIGPMFFVSYVSRGVFEPMFRALSNRQIRPQHRASVISLITMVSRVGSILALVALGPVAARSLGQSFAIAALVFVVCLPGLMLLHRQLLMEETHER